MGKQKCQLHVLTLFLWENKNATNLLIDFDAHRSHHRMFDKQPALEDTRRNLWVQVHVPVRSRVRASTFWDGGQNFLFNFFCFTELAANSTFQHVLYGEQKNKKQADLMLLHTFTWKIIMSHLHVLTRSLWGTKTRKKKQISCCYMLLHEKTS